MCGDGDSGQGEDEQLQKAGPENEDAVERVLAQLQQAKAALCDKLTRAIEMNIAIHKPREQQACESGHDEDGACKPCAIFSTPGRPGWSHFRRHATIVPSAVLKGGLQDVEAYREEEARRMGCRAADVCWWLRSECFPEITCDGEISSHSGTLACTVKLHFLFLATLVHCAAKLAQLKRLESHRDALLDITACVAGVPLLPDRKPAPSPPSPPRRNDAAIDTESDVESHTHNTPAPPAAAGTGADDDSDSLPGASISTGMHSLLVIYGNTEPAGAVPPALAPAAQLQRFWTMGESLLERMTAELARQLHPADLAATLRRFLQIHAMGERMVPPGPNEALTGVTGIAATRDAAAAAMRTAQQAIHSTPRAPAPPLTREVVDAAVEECLESMRAAQVEWAVAIALSMLDMPHVLLPVMHAMIPVHLGYVQFEGINIMAYKAMAFTRDQKEALVRRWREHQRQARQLLAARRALLSDLCIHADDDTPPEPSSNSDSDRSTSTPVAGGWLSARPAAPPVPYGGAESPPAAAPLRGCLRNMLGASPHSTAAAARALVALRRLQTLSTRLYVQWNTAFWCSLTAPQCAAFITCVVPFLPDSFRIAEMAATDLIHERTFGPRRICVGAALAGSPPSERRPHRRPFFDAWMEGVAESGA